MPATTGGRPSSGTTRSGYTRKRKSRSAPASQGHPSQGAPTVGGGTTKGGRTTPTTVYRSPTPSIKKQRAVSKRRSAAKARGEAVRTMGPLASQPTASERIRAKRKKARERKEELQTYLRERDNPSRGGHPTRGGVGETPEPKKAKLPDFYKDTMRPKTFRALERHVARQKPIERAESKALTRTRDKDTKILGVNVEAEAEGRGIAPKIGKKVGDLLAPTSGAALRSSGVMISDKTAENATRDIADLTANLPSGGYMTLAAAKEAAQGDTKRAKKLWKDYKDSSAIPALVSGDVKEALKRANERPVSTALELSGGKAIVGRAVGAAGRAGLGGKRAKRYTSDRARTDQRLYPGGLRTEGPKVARVYSKDAITMARQKRADRRAIARGEDPGQTGGGRTLGGVTLKQPNRQTKMRPDARPQARGELMRRIDTRRAGGERARRQRIKRAGNESGRLAPPRSRSRYPAAGVRSPLKRSESGLVQYFSEGTALTAKAARADLQRRLDALVAARPEAIKRGRGGANKAEIARLREALAIPEERFETIFESAQQWSRHQNERQRRGEKAGVFTEGEDFARFVPVLKHHMGAKYDAKPRNTPEYENFKALRVEERKAARDVRVARQKLETAKRHEARGEGVAQLQATAGRKQAGEVYHRGMPDEAATRFEQGKANGAPDGAAVWAGDAETAAYYAREHGNGTGRVIQVRVNKGKTLDTDSRQYAVLSGHHPTPTKIEAAARKLGYDSLSNRRLGWVKVFDQKRVKPTGRQRRTDLTQRQGERLLKLQGARMTAEAAHTKALEAAKAATKARKDAHVPKGARRERGWRLPDGRLATKADVEAFLRSQGRDPDTIGHISDEPALLNMDGEDIGMFQQPLKRSGSANVPFKRQRRGGAYELGREDIGGEAMARQAMISEGRITAAELRHLDFEEFGVPAGSNGRHYAETRAEADENLRAQTHDPETGQLLPGQFPMRAVNIDGLRASGEQLRILQENAQGQKGSAALSKVDQELLAESARSMFAGGEGGKGRWIGLPEDVVNRIIQHADVRTYGQLNQITNLFKDVVLTSASPSSWLLGGASDLTFRSIMAGITPSDIARGYAVAHRLEGKGLKGEMAAAELTGGGLVHSAQAAARVFSPGVARENIARTIAAAPWRTWKAGVYAIEHAIENVPQWGVIGKEARRGTPRKVDAVDLGFKEQAKRLLHMHDEQIDNYAVKLADDEAHRARVQALTEDVIGRWGKISPELRRSLGAGPFIQWLNAAVRYTMVTLPTKHPIKTGIMASLMEMTEEERGKLGLSYMIPFEERVQDYQMGTLPMEVKRVKNPDGTWRWEVTGWRTQNLTSFGTAGQVAHNPLRGGASFAFPQFRGAFMAAFGIGWTGEPMVYPDWWPNEEQRGMPLDGPDLNKVGIGLLMESTIPFAGMFNMAVQERGKSALPQSTILSPQLRKSFDKDTGKWTESKGAATGGLIEWLSPVSKSKLLTHRSVKKIREGQEAGRVGQRAKDQADDEVLKYGGRPAVKVNQRLREIRKAKSEIIAKNPGVDSDNPTPKYAQLHREERRYNERLYKLTKGKKGHHYKTPYDPSGDGGAYGFGAGGDGGATDFSEPAPEPDTGGGGGKYDFGGSSSDKYTFD